MSAVLKEIQQQLIANGTDEGRLAQGKFAVTSARSYGVRMPVLNGLATQYKQYGFDLVEELWKAGALEEKILAIKILEKIGKKDADRSLKLVKVFAKGIDNWAVCDALGMQALRGLVNTHENEIFVLAQEWNKSKNFWIRRLSLVVVEWYTRKKELHPRIKQLIKGVANDEEYYVKKAIVWIEKNFTKGK